MQHRSLLRSVLLVAVALVASLGARAASADELEQRFADANAKLEARQFKEALEIYNGLLEAEPDAGNVWVMRAVAKWNLKDQSGARADLAQAIKLHPDNIDAYRVRGQMRYEAKDFQASLDDFNAAIGVVERAVASADKSEEPFAREFARQNAELYGMRAEARKHLGERDAAIRDLSRAIELKPDYAAALFLRGQLRETANNPAGAAEDYSKVLELQPKHADALNNRAWIRFHELKWADAIADGRATLALAPKAVVAMRVVGYSQFALGDYAAAAQSLTAAADADPTSDGAFALFVRHFALVRQGTPDKRVATSWGRWADAPWLQALAKFIGGTLDEEGLEAAAKDTTDDGELAGRACEMHFYIGLARLQAGDKSTARLRFQSAIATDQKTFVEHALAHAELQRLKK